MGTYIEEKNILPKTKVGRFCAIGPDVRLILGRHPAHGFVSIHPAFYSTRKQAGFTFVDENKLKSFQRANILLKLEMMFG